MNINADVSLLQAALVGFQISREKIDERITAIRRELDGNFLTAVSRPTGRAKPERHMSAAARNRIAAASRKRWAAFRAAKRSAAVPQAPPKRKLSTAARAKLAENLKRARAAKAVNRAKAISRD